MTTVKFTMKTIKSLFFIALLTLPMSLLAQGPADALRFSQNYYEGTARTMAMGNAFTALGGDLGAIAINPASSGIFRYSEFTFSPSYITSMGSSTYLNNTANESSTKMALSNLGFVSTFNTGNYNGLLNYNFAVTINRTNSFNTIMGATGKTDQSSWLGSAASNLQGINSSQLGTTSEYNPYYKTSLPWSYLLAWDTYLLANTPDSNVDYLGSTENIVGNNIIVGGDIEQEFYKKTTGGVNECTINFGGNYSDFLYFGINLNLLSLNYEYNEYYAETAVNTINFQDGFNNFTNSYTQRTSGSGLNAKFGIIVTPLPFLRFGATFTTPTWYEMSDTWVRNMTSAFSNGNKYSKDSPTGAYDYCITTPFRWSIGAAITFGNRGLISADYERVDYSSITMSDSEGRNSAFSNENKYINSNYITSNIFRLGAELLLSSSLSLRGGYDYYGTSGDDYPSVQYLTCGLGFKLGKSGKTTIDVAYQKMLELSESFTLYNDYEVTAPVGTYTGNTNKLVFTLGFKF